MQILSLHLLASMDTESLGPKWTGHPTALLFELRARIPWEVAAAVSAWPPTHRCATVVFYFLLSAWWHLCHMDSIASSWEEASRGEEPEADSNFVLKEPAIPGPPSSMSTRPAAPALH